MSQSVAREGTEGGTPTQHNLHWQEVPRGVPGKRGFWDGLNPVATERNITGQVAGRRWDEGSILHWSLPVGPAQGFYVYVAWGSLKPKKNARPLYVGRSRGLLSRISSHLRHSPWADKAKRFDFYAFFTEQEADAAEIQAIVDLNPRYNVRRIQPPITGISDDQLEIIRRVQNRKVGP